MLRPDMDAKTGPERPLADEEPVHRTTIVPGPFDHPTTRVEILLSTYKAGPYLEQLLDSLWAQDYTDFCLLVRDDGSGDGTVDLTRRYLAQRPCTRLLESQHLGAGRSFLALLREVDPAAGYAAFCDQDDVWQPGKLTTAVDALRRTDGPALYCSAVELVDHDLSKIKIHRRCVKGPSFENALVENVATGCTIVLNRPAIDLLSSRMPDDFIMHDAWCYVVVAGCGTVLYDPHPQVLYRLHSSNAIGVSTSAPSEWTNRLLRELRSGREHLLTRQALELRRLYSDRLHPSAMDCLVEFLASQSTLTSRLVYSLRGKTHFQRQMDNLAYRLLYLAHRV